MLRRLNRHERRSRKHRLRERNPPSSPPSIPPRPVAAGRTVLVESSHAERRRLAKAIATSSDSTSSSGNP